MDNPTHADAFLNLISSCFPCRPTAPALPPSPRLGALLRDPESDDAMSLHSTYRPHTRQKKKKPAMQLCGVNLFGKPRGQIRLEDDDDEPAISRPRPRYDSDAAPLPDSTIQNLSISGRSPTTEQPTRHESPEEELARLRAEKAARKARKRERKLKRQLALEQTGDFEGFIGSGSGGGFPISPPSTTTSTPGIEDLLEGSDRGSMRLVDDADPEDADADMGAAVYTRSTRSRSESGSSATRSSRAREEGLAPGNALGLGLRGPPSPLVQEYIPEARDESEVQARSEPITEPAPIIIEPQPKPEPIIESKPSPQITESKPTPRPRPKIHISDMPLSSPGAGPGPRTLENSPRLASKREELETPKQDSYGFPSPRLSIPRPSPGIPTSPGPGLPSPRLGLPSPGGFPSMGLTRKGSFGGLGKSYGSGTGLGLNSNSAGAGTGGSQSSFNTSGNRSPLGGSKSPLAGRDGDVLDAGGDGRRSGDAGSQRSGGSGDGSGVDGSSQGGGGPAQRLGSGRVTAGMGVALANRGGE